MSELPTYRTAYPLWAMTGEVAEKLSSALHIPEEDLTQGRVADTLSRLPRQFSSAIQIRLVAGMDREDCAEAIGVCPATFDVLLGQATCAFEREWSRS
jgi:DNA-directed RNA polymerase specialized sigma24 family protein